MTTSMVGIKTSHIHKNLTQKGEPRKSCWGMQKKKKKKKKSGYLCSHVSEWLEARDKTKQNVIPSLSQLEAELPLCTN